MRGGKEKHSLDARGQREIAGKSPRGGVLKYSVPGKKKSIELRKNQSGTCQVGGGKSLRRTKENLLGETSSLKICNEPGKNKGKQDLAV